MEQIILRKCVKCGVEATTETELDLFINNHGSKHGKQNLCKDCKKQEDFAYRQTDKGRMIARRSNKKYRENNPDSYNASIKKYRATERYLELQRVAALKNHYAHHEESKHKLRQHRAIRRLQALIKLDPEPKCANCGIDNEIVLTFDHINNDGAEERKKLRHYQILTRILEMDAEDARKEFQILCRNCNWEKHIETNVRQDR